MKPIMLLVFLLLMATSGSSSHAIAIMAEKERAAAKKAAAAAAPVLKAAAVTGAKAAGLALLEAAKDKLAKDDKYDPKAAKYDPKAAKYDPKAAKYDPKARPKYEPNRMVDVAIAEVLARGNPYIFQAYIQKKIAEAKGYYVRGEASKKLGSYYGLLADAVRPKSQASPGAGGVGVAQTAPLVLVAVGALLVTVARRRSAPASTMPLL